VLTRTSLMLDPNLVISSIIISTHKDSLHMWWIKSMSFAFVSPSSLSGTPNIIIFDYRRSSSYLSSIILVVCSETILGTLSLRSVIAKYHIAKMHFTDERTWIFELIFEEENCAKFRARQHNYKFISLHIPKRYWVHSP
jgi:hypothetical protein